ncbi:MAG: serine hydrolase, partial [Clostridium sp.]|nr:serine hydrolase [Clostridium sp.]
LKNYAPLAAGILATVLLLAVGISVFHSQAAKQMAKKEPKEEAVVSAAGRLTPARYGLVEKLAEQGFGAGILEKEKEEEKENSQNKQNKVYVAQTTDATLQLGEGDTVSEYAILIDLDKGNVLAERNANVRMNPASMTKILTALVAAEQIQDLDDTITVTREITDYGYINDCSSAGFEIGEEVTLKDLFYGTILPSGADAAVGLAVYVSGSQEAFVELMNQKLEELGLSRTAHFTNCVGVFDENHYCTVYDMAMIMEAAMDNELCREVMSTRIYTTTKTEEHPEGIELSNWFIRRIEDKDSGGKVLGGKTGYVAQSGNCAASFAATDNGLNLVCVTANASGRWRCIEDHVKLYKQFSK